MALQSTAVLAAVLAASACLAEDAADMLELPPPTPQQQAGERLRLAETYRSAGMTDRAREILLSVIQEFPASEAAGQARKQIEALGRK